METNLGLFTDNLAAIDARIKDLSSSISSQFVDLQNLPYRLQSVFIHVGSATFGHYWIYIRDFEKNMWRKYNDESVSAVTDVSQIFDQDPSDRPPTPYFLVYVKDELKDQLVNPVCRDVLPQQQPSPPPQQPQYDTSDAVMNDAGNDYPMTVTDAVEDGQGTTVAIGDWYKADNAGKQIEW